ncbi:MAG: flagellar basal body P-ring protein FlgI [Planctomycetia bacterium]|nr:flagellar basal body P-ring protein FlgI [Planctomycetia bacterium]
MLTGRRHFLFWMLTLSLSGCQKLSLRSQNPDDDDDIKPPETQFIKDQVTVSGLNAITIESVGLVRNLDGTGGDPPPSIYRTMLVNDMRKRDVPNPNNILKDPNNALVLIRAAVPPVIDVGDHFDVEIVLPENTDASSLKGGWLMQADLSEQAMVPGQNFRKGHILAKAEGPILLSTGEGESASRASVLKRGRVLGGARYVGGLVKKGRTLGLYVRSDLRSVRTTKKIADHIGKRFHYHDHGIKKPLAEAKTDQHVELKVHHAYKENYMRYVRVIRAIALDETPLELRERTERLRKSLLVPQTASASATELEAIGADATLILKEGLKSPDPEVRFYSADALAYLGDGAGTKELERAARREPAFRIFALAALTTLGTPEARQALKEMMITPSVEVVDGQEQEVFSAETRYGAFRALWTIDRNDEYIGGLSFNDEFHLHVIESAGDAMAHLTRFRVPQVVLFGSDQKLKTPVSLTAGRHIMITAPSNSDTITVSRFHSDLPDEKITCSTNLADVIRAVGNMRASYPDVAQMLVQAERQSNLSGRLEIDAMPQAGRIYYRTGATDAGTPGKRDEIRVGDPNQVPNMFPATPRKNGRDGESTEDRPTARRERADESGSASIADVSEGSDEPKQAGGFFGWFRKKPANSDDASN